MTGIMIVCMFVMCGVLSVDDRCVSVRSQCEALLHHISPHLLMLHMVAGMDCVRDLMAWRSGVGVVSWRTAICALWHNRSLADTSLTMSMQCVSSSEALSASRQRRSSQSRSDLPRTVERLVTAVNPHMPAKVVLSDKGGSTIC